MNCWQTFLPGRVSEKKTIKLELGTLLLDSCIICFNKELYDEMNQDKKTDLLQFFEVAWGHGGLILS
jgi:hypothetical protein